MKIKICGLCREEEIAAVNEVQPDYIGFVFAQGSRRYVDPRQAALLRQGLSKGIAAAGVFTDAPLEQILQLVYGKVIDVVQLHGNETLEFAEDLKCCCDVPVVKAVSMTEDTYSIDIKSTAVWITCFWTAAGEERAQLLIMEESAVLPSPSFWPED